MKWCDQNKTCDCPNKYIVSKRGHSLHGWVRSVVWWRNNTFLLKDKVGNFLFSKIIYSDRVCRIC